MADINVRLGGDNSQFRAMLSESASQAEKFSGEIAGKVAGKLTGMRDISTAVAAALGINLSNIAENVARLFTGMSKDVEKAYKELDVVGTQVADASIKNMRALLTEEQKYILNLNDRDKLQKQIANTVATTVPQQVALKQIELKMHEKISEIIAYEKKQREEMAKVAEEAAKKQMDAAEKSNQAGINVLATEEKISALKFNIAATEEMIASGRLTALESERFSATLAERKNQLVSEEGKLKDAAAKETEAHSKRMEQMSAKEIEDKRELLTAAQEMMELKKDEAALIAVLADKEIESSERNKAEYDLAKVRAKMRDVEKEKKEEDIELAKLLLIPAEKLTETEQIRIDVLKGVTTQRAIDEERTTLIAGLVAGTLTPAEKARLAVLMGQTVEIEKQNKKLEIQNTITRKGKGYEAQSDDSLEGVKNRLEDQIAQAERDRFGQIAGVGGNTKTFAQTLLESELFNLNKEISERDAVRDYASRFGEQKARQQFGDTITDKALRDMTDLQVRGVNAQEDIAARLAILFPKK